MFLQMLEAARSRLVNQERELVEIGEAYAEAVKKGMVATGKLLKAKLRRWEMAVALSRAGVAELEAACKQGALPLESKGLAGNGRKSGPGST